MTTEYLYLYEIRRNLALKIGKKYLPVLGSISEDIALDGLLHALLNANNTPSNKYLNTCIRNYMNLYLRDNHVKCFVSLEALTDNEDISYEPEDTEPTPEDAFEELENTKDYATKLFIVKTLLGNNYNTVLMEITKGNKTESTRSLIRQCRKRFEKLRNNKIFKDLF